MKKTPGIPATIAMLLYLSAAPVASASELLEGLFALGRNDYEQAARILLPLAEKGDPLAQVNVGTMYLDGRGVPRDESMGIHWHERAARQGVLVSQYLLARTYGDGDTPTNAVRGMMWFEVIAREARSLGARLAQEQLVRARELARACIASRFSRCD
ncbi:MAG: tetratricopeptide repeat protein [Alphaproteobacteria bacterium]